MRLPKIILLFFVGQGMILSPSSWVGGEEGSQALALDEILPSETLVFFRFADAAIQRQGFEASVLKPISEIPEMRDFLEDLAKRRQDFIRVVAQEAKLTPDFVRQVMEGQLSFALLDLISTEGGVSTAYVVAIDLEQKPDHEMLFSAIRAAVAEYRARRKLSPNEPQIPLKNAAWQENWPGGHIVMMIAGKEPLRFVLLGKTLLLFQGPDSRLLKEILANSDNRLTAKSLAKNRVYREVCRGADVRAGNGFLYLNVPRLYSLLSAIGLPRVTALLDTLGFSSVQGLGMSSGFYHDGQAFAEGIRHTMYLYAPTERRGILRMLSFRSGAERAAEAVPLGSQGMFAARVDFQELYRQLPPLLDAVEKAFRLEQSIGFAKLVAEQELLGVPIAEILGTLGDRMIIQPGPCGLVFRFDMARVEDFRKIITRMEQNAGASFAGTFATLPSGRTHEIRYFNRSGLPLPFAPSFAIFPRPGEETGVVYCATHPQAIKALLRQPVQGTLLESPDFQRVQRGMGKDYGVFLYIDNRSAYAEIYDTLLPVANFLTALPVFAADPGKLPPGEELEPFLLGCGVGAKNDPSGITMVAYSPIGIGGFLIFLIDKLHLLNPTTLGTLAGFAKYWEIPSPSLERPPTP